MIDSKKNQQNQEKPKHWVPKEVMDALHDLIFDKITKEEYIHIYIQ